jgi:hypothetical protein
MGDEPDLNPSTSSEWVLYLQQLLNHHYQETVVPESGEFDETTASVVRYLRNHNGLEDSDLVDQTVWRVLTGERQAIETRPEDAREPEPEWPEAQSVKVWVNAFIPGSYGGNIDGVGAASGHRLLPGPCAWFHDCFHTDDREFSNDIRASYRAHSEFRLELPSTELSEWHDCGETIEHDCEDGDVECRETASTARMHWSDVRRSGSVIELDISAASNNPCFSGSPDIHYVGTVSIDLAGRTISFQGLVKGFPAYEGYATINDGAGQELFTHGPTGDPDSLFADPDMPVSGSVAF